MKLYTYLAVVFFTLVAIAHLLRLIFGWVITVNGITIPILVSGVAVLIAAGLSVMLFREARR